MGWAVHYRDFEIYPSVVPLRHNERGIVGFVPIANVYQAGKHDEPLVELGPPDRVTFLDAAAAADYILSHAKGMIDGEEEALKVT